jgi:hypothetical protein
MPFALRARIRRRCGGGAASPLQFFCTEVDKWVILNLMEKNTRKRQDIKKNAAWIDQPSIVPFIKCLSNGEKKFRNEVVERMIARTQQRDGRCSETFRRINVTAAK